MTPLALESYWAVLGGLIPIVGATGAFFLIWYAVRDSPEDDEEGRDDERRDPPDPTE